MFGLKMLVIDDDLVLQSEIKKYFGVYNEIFFANSLKDARSLIGKSAYSIVLLDQNLPDGSGYDLIAPVKSKSLKTAIVIITGDPDFNGVQKAINLGADDYLIKSDETISDLLIRIPVAINSATRKYESQMRSSYVSLELPMTGEEINPSSFERFLGNAERAFIESALKLSLGSVSLCAERLGLARSTLFKKLSQFQINRTGEGKTL